MLPCKIQVEGQTAYCRRAKSLSPEVRHPIALSWLFQLYDGLVSSVNRIVPSLSCRESQCKHSDRTRRSVTFLEHGSKPAVGPPTIRHLIHKGMVV